MQHPTFAHALTTTLLLVPLASAHFQLSYPATVGFSDDNEGTAPCGGFDITDATFSNATDFHVDGDAVALTSTHPHSDWLFRATLDKTAKGDNFTNLLPIVSQAGLGAFCEPMLTVPGMWAGSQGVIQIQQTGSDGSLYQCAAVNFVPSKATEAPSSCKNATGLTASFSTASPSASSMSPAPSATSTTPSPSPSSAGSAAASIHQYSALSPLLWSGLALAGVGAMGFVCV